VWTDRRRGGTEGGREGGREGGGEGGRGGGREGYGHEVTVGAGDEAQ
jgi:hypothetical protein